MSNIKCPRGYKKSKRQGHHAGCVKNSKRSSKKQSKKRSGNSKKQSKRSAKSRGNIRCPPGYKKAKGKGCQPK
jgi:hypothetical protein